ncbi:MAG TPA: carboxypeptidase regulatory-like domain-containing protein [Acidobacteriaceae bacterium]|nr:carboxypeptidase regulatory-like domain-containing protein [Acidobacteriaceae bacterium]
MSTLGYAQYRASIQGVVTDPTGAVVPGATVTLTDNATNHVQTSTTSNSGIYTFNALPPSHFTLTVERQGFKKKTLSDVQIIPEQANALNVQLEIGESSQSVTVSGASTPLLDTETATISGTISSNEIQHLPSFGRDVFQLAQLAPGVFGDGSQGSGGGSYSLPGSNSDATGATDGIFKTENAPQIIANGGHNEANGISIDGISTVSAVWGGSTVITPSEDSIEDVKIISNSYNAENGRFSAAQIQVTTKSGTNDVHGSLFFKADRPGLNAYQAYNGPSSVEPGTAADRGLLRDESRFNQFGGSVGGPIWKNKIFAFFNYETLRNNTSSTATGWYDTSEFDTMAPAGSIAAKYLTFPGAAVSSAGQIAAKCVNIGLVEGTNCRTIPGKGLDIGSPLKSALGTQDFTYVSGGQPGVGSGLDGIADIGDYTTLNPNTVTEAQYNGRMDANVTGKDRLTFTIYWVPEDTTDYNGPVRAYNLYHHSSINDAFAGLWDHTFSPTLVNEARFNAAGWRWNEIETNPQEPFGLPSDSIPQIGNLTSFSDFGAPGPSVFDQWTYSYEDVMTKVAGPHNISFGGGVTRLYYLNEAPYAAVPSFGFYNVWDFLNDAPESEGGTFDPLTGVPTANRQDDREDLWGFFVQDDYKIRPNLTINLGLRYSYFGPFSSKDQNLSVLQLGTGNAMFNDIRLRVGGNLYTAQKGNFGPEVGFAWSPAANQGKFVVRGGFGMNYDEEEIAISANGGSNPPSVVTPNFSSVSPTQISPGIVYQIPSDVHSLFGYPPNRNTIVKFNSNNLPTTGQVGVTGFPANLPTMYSYHYSLGTQYQIGQQWVATLGYQGSIGRHIITQYNANVLGAAYGIPLNPTVNSVDYYGNEGNSSYNAMLVGLKHEFSHTFLADADYTWSKSMDDGSQPYYEDPYPYNPKLAWGRSDYNVQNAFKLYGLWQPVFFHGSHGWIEKVAGGWSLSGIYNVHTGFPWTPTYSNIAGGNLYYQGSGYGSLRPAAYKGAAGHDTSNRAFESGPVGANQSAFNKNYSGGALAYFTVPTYTTVTNNFPATTPPPQAPGVARNFLDGPNYRDVDATLTKAFGFPRMPVLGESANFEIRVDVFNLFNTVNLDSAQINTAISNDGVTSNPSFGQAQAALGSRTLDVQARFSF